MSLIIDSQQSGSHYGARITKQRAHQSLCEFARRSTPLWQINPNELSHRK